ncbi:MAG: rRNA adenine N-6-methyltransferase family protein [Bacteroidales bacterium]
MNHVRAKKHLGQHFLKDDLVAERIAGTLSLEGYSAVLEVGPGTGALTRFLLKRDIPDFRAIEIDGESVSALAEQFPELDVISGDFLNWDIDSIFGGPYAVTGNFPYNISSQIFSGCTPATGLWKLRECFRRR